MAMNSVNVIGRLTKDIELKYTPGGMAIGSGSIAVDHSVKKNGEWVKEAYFFEISIFGKQAEGLKDYLTKGKEIGIEGYLKQDRWTDQNTQQQRSKISIVANDITLLGGKSNGNGNQNQEPQEAGYSYDGAYGYGN